jgi:hypothetical protein
MSTVSVRKVDESGLKTGQALTIILLIVAYVVYSPALVAFVAVAQLLGAADAPYAPYRLFYQHVLKGRLLQPKVIVDNPEPHRFAMLLGGVVNTAATIALVVGTPVVAWVLVAIVVVLANLNFWLNFCLGCWMYYQFNRLGLPGFTVAPMR